MHQTSNKGQCCQQPNYNDRAIKPALTIELDSRSDRSKSRTMC